MTRICLGSARASRAGDRALATANFSSDASCGGEEDFGEGTEISTRGASRSPELPLRRARHKINMSYLDLLRLASPEAVVVVTALVVLSMSLVTKRAAAACAFVAALGLVIAIVAVLFLPRDETLFGGMLVISPLTSLFKIICLALAALTILLTHAEKAPRHPGEYLALVLLATVGLMLLVGSEELLMIFIGLELLGLSLYVLAAFDKTDVRSAEAGLKYFLFGSTSSAFTLFGISLIYGMSGATGLAAISAKLATMSVAAAACGWNRHDTRRLRIQNRCRAVPSMGA